MDALVSEHEILRGALEALAKGLRMTAAAAAMR